MGKLRIPSWLQGTSNDAAPPADAETKKQHRRSNLSQLMSKADAPAPPQKPAASATPSTSASETSHIIALAKKISAEAEKLERYMRDNGLPDPGFGADAPGDFPKLPDDVQQSRQEIVYATNELNALARGPRETFLDSTSLSVLNKYNIANLVPRDAPIPLSELQNKTSLDPINLARSLRHAMTNYVFQEPSPGVIAHTAASRMLAEDGALQDWVGFDTEEVMPAAANVLRALAAHPEATSLTRAGFQFAFDTVDKEPMFVTFGRDPARARRVAGAMASLTGGEGYEVRWFVDNYDFAAVNERGGTLVDIGGSHGFVCVDLAKRWDKMRFVVQDLQKTVDSAPKPISEDKAVADRIEFQAHDFFTEQPVKGADAYFFRWIIHNYSTPYAVTLLRNLVPALKPGARVIINDHCLRDYGTENPWDEKVMRGMDMTMLALLNSQERQEHEFRELFRAADERYSFKGVTRVEGCRMSVIEAVWEPGTEADPATENGTATEEAA